LEIKFLPFVFLPDFKEYTIGNAVYFISVYQILSISI